MRRARRSTKEEHMDELLALIARIGTDDPPSLEELTEARAELAENMKAALEAKPRDMEAAKAINEAREKVNAELTRLAEEAEAEEAEARRLLEQLDEPKAEVEAEADTETEAAEADKPTESEKAARQPEPVAASSNLRAALRRTTTRVRQEEPAGTSNVQLLTLNAAQSERLPQNATLSDLANVFDRATQRVKTPGDRQALVRVEYDYPINRQLNAPHVYENNALLDAVLATPVVAAGGICDPLPADFSHPVIGDRGRPIRAGLPRFQGSRGGVRFSPTITIPLTSTPTSGTGVGVWTYATDENPGSATKTCAVVECDDDVTAYVDAVYACLQIGNFTSRFNPEYWRARLDLLMLYHDRIAERKLYADMEASATAYTTYGGSNGTIYSVLSAIDKTAAAMRSRLRFRGQLRVVLPEWVHQALRADIASQRLGSAPGDALTVADTVINSFFASRGVTPIWSLDLDIFATQTAGTSQSPVALNDFPGANVDLLIYPEGAYFFLDGGTLDLGTEIVDSTLIAQNNRMAFLETFEKAVFRGGESIRVTVPVDELCVCPNVEAA
jgi:hypothetical protein